MILVTEDKNLQLLGIEKKQAKITEEYNNKVITMLSKQYGDIIGTPIVETVCNAFDTQKEAGTLDMPILIDYKAGYIHIKDCGMGINPYKMENTIMSYGVSTRTENDIGAYGCGFKSIFAYTDVFFVDSIVDNVKYCYQLIHESYKGVTYLLLSEYPINEINGTDVYWKIKVNDKYRFDNAISAKMKYFKNIIVQGFGFNNDFKLFETDNYIYSTASNNTYLELSLGGVVYPINYNLLSISSINLPGAIKFSLSEGIKPPPNRETIEYTQQAIKLITNKIETVKQELFDLYEKQFKDEYDSLKEITDYHSKIGYLFISDNHKINLRYTCFSLPEIVFKHKNIDNQLLNYGMYDFKNILKFKGKSDFTYYRSNLELKEIRKYEKTNNEKIISKEYLERIEVSKITGYFSYKYVSETLILEYIESINQFKDAFFNELPLFEDNNRHLKIVIKAEKFKNSSDCFKIKRGTYFQDISTEEIKKFTKNKLVIVTSDNDYYKNFKIHGSNVTCIYASKSNVKYTLPYCVTVEQFEQTKFYKKQLCYNYQQKNSQIVAPISISHLRSLFLANTRIRLKIEIPAYINEYSKKIEKLNLKFEKMKNECNSCFSNFYDRDKKYSMYLFLKKNNYKFPNYDNITD